MKYSLLKCVNNAAVRDVEHQRARSTVFNTDLVLQDIAQAALASMAPYTAERVKTIDCSLLSAVSER